MNDCNIHDNGWKIFLNNAHRFKRLKKIGIGKNIEYFTLKQNTENR
jgi:hypothetical protein